jgi:hypothetical protein
MSRLHSLNPLLVAIVSSSVALAVVGGTGALASHGPGVIHACVNNENGAVRIVGSASDCRNSERSIHWDERAASAIPLPQSCPGGQFVTGIDADGRLTCATGGSRDGGGDGTTTSSTTTTSSSTSTSSTTTTLPCSDGSDDTIQSAVHIGSVAGDVGDSLRYSSTICREDVDWIRFELREANNDFWNPEDLTARITLSMGAAGGDLDLCVYESGVLVDCSFKSGTQEETVSLDVGDNLSNDDTKLFYARITGWPPETSVNNWTLTITGNA